MIRSITLETYLSGWATAIAGRLPIAQTISAIAGAAIKISELVSLGRLAGEIGASTGVATHGDEQKELDLQANDILLEALLAAPVAAVASEELEQPVVFDETASLIVALDPLDGSSNIETNVSIGTIFSILPVPASHQGNVAHAFLQPGSAQCAAGYVIYGPQTSLVITVGKGTVVFILDRRHGCFCLANKSIQIPAQASEYAINASNYRHWSASIKAYIDDCNSGSDGPRGVDFNTRWIASLIAECHRILMRGGVFLYPSDARNGYENGRLRLIYEANPIAMLIQQSGGKAIDGQSPILSLVPRTLHQRTPLMFGSAGEVDRILQYKADPNALHERSPLFGRRGLLKG